MDSKLRAKKKRKIARAIKNVFEEHGWYLDDDTYYTCKNPACGNSVTHSIRTIKFCDQCGREMRAKKTNECNSQIWEAFERGLEIWEEK